MGYTIPIFLEQGHEVYGVDNFWKYGTLSRGFETPGKTEVAIGFQSSISLISAMALACPGRYLSIFEDFTSFTDTLFYKHKVFMQRYIKFMNSS